MRHHVFGKAGHRTLHQSRVHESSLIEVANEFIHAVRTAQCLDALHTVIGITEDAHFAVDIVVRHPLHSGHDLLEGFVALDGAGAVWPQPLASGSEETQHAGKELVRGD